jgi:hypothetical protein
LAAASLRRSSRCNQSFHCTCSRCCTTCHSSVDPCSETKCRCSCRSAYCRSMAETASLQHNLRHSHRPSRSSRGAGTAGQPWESNKTPCRSKCSLGRRGIRTGKSGAAPHPRTLRRSRRSSHTDPIGCTADRTRWSTHQEPSRHCPRHRLGSRPHGPRPPRASRRCGSHREIERPRSTRRERARHRGDKMRRCEETTARRRRCRSRALAAGTPQTLGQSQEGAASARFDSHSCAARSSV